MHALLLPGVFVGVLNVEFGVDSVPPPVDNDPPMVDIDIEAGMVMDDTMDIDSVSESGGGSEFERLFGPKKLFIEIQKLNIKQKRPFLCNK